MTSLLCELSMEYFLLWPWPLVPRRSKVDNSGLSCQLNGCSLSDFPEQSIPISVSYEKGKSYRENFRKLFCAKLFFAFCLHAKNAKISASFFAQLIIAAKPLSAKLLIVLAYFVKSLFREKYESFRSLKTLIPIVGQKVITPNNKCNFRRFCKFK